MKEPHSLPVSPSVNLLVRLISNIEVFPVTPAQAALTFLAIVLVRYGLESLLEARHALALHLDLRLGLTDFLHVLVSWAVLYALLALGLAFFSGREQARANRMALAGFPLIWLPPLWDFVFGSSGEIVYPHDFFLFASSFIGLFNPFVAVPYVTPGVRVEVACAVGLSALYAGFWNREAAAWWRGVLKQNKRTSTLFWAAPPTKQSGCPFVCLS